MTLTAWGSGVEGSETTSDGITTEVAVAAVGMGPLVGPLPRRADAAEATTGTPTE
jgi:hypothetical protein